MPSTTTSIQLYNTRTRKKDPFRPIDPANVRMYVCGPTVYDRAHIGNARPVVVFDVLYRLLRHVYGDKSVTYARNFTDVDDRIINRAVETKRADETLEAACRRITDETIGWYHEDMDALGALRPTHEPRCTEYIPQMVAMTQRLIDQGHAYAAEGHVLFAVDTYADYGKLARRSLDDMVAGARVEKAPYKKNPMDFVLWKPSTPEQPGWDSPWGRGRPGWHIECSAMADELLWEEPCRKGRLSEDALRHPHVFDIHGGGIDLAFPHHENEVAQSCCANHTEVMANVWMHNGFLQVEGEKMAKSLGNFFTVKDLLNKKIPGAVIRLVLLSSHYREPLDWTENAVDEADRTLVKWGEIVGAKPAGNVPEDIVDALSDDLNTPQAIAVLHKLAKEGRAEELRAAIRFLGLGVIVASRGHAVGVSAATAVGDALVHTTRNDSDELLSEMDQKQEDFTVLEMTKIRELLINRKLAREQKDYKEADRIRDGLIVAGVEVRDTPEGATYRRMPDFDPAKLEALK